MLTLLKIENIALIERLEIEFGQGLNLLTGETGSGKSIIVDSLGALTGERMSSDLIKQGAASARIEGVFEHPGAPVRELLEASGIDAGDELIIRRELSSAGRNRIFINDQTVTVAFLKKIGTMVVDIHGQGEQTTLYEPSSHLGMLDAFAGVEKELHAVAEAHAAWAAVRQDLASLERDESEKLQLLDILRFQVNEISAAGLVEGEEESLEQEKLQLNNVERLSSLSDDAYAQLYENEHSTLSTLERAVKCFGELAEFDPRFAEFTEPLSSAVATVEEAAFTARDYRSKLEFSPDRLNEIESRLAEITRLKRKYGGSTATVLEHLKESEERLNKIETAEFHEAELRKKIEAAAEVYSEKASALSAKRNAAASRFSRAVESELRSVALEKARFEIRLEASGDFSQRGSDRVEFYFSANPGEAAKPLAKVASGGEASRLMLVLKTVSRARGENKTAVFDEIDIGIGGRVAEAVGRRLKDLSREQQVFCVTHQPQIASLADQHFVVEKQLSRNSTAVSVRQLAQDARIDEIARMLAGEQVTEAARENARTMLAAGAARTREAKQ